MICNLKYETQLQRLVENALLHLYSAVSHHKKETGHKFVKTELRNNIISKFLKNSVKKKQYDLLKKDIKSLIRQKESESLENKLLELLKTDVQKLFKLLNYFEANGFKSELIDEKPDQKSDVIFFLQAHLDFCFDDEDKQIDVVSLLIKTKQIEKFNDILKEQSFFDYELVQKNEENYNYHYFLHKL